MTRFEAFEVVERGFGQSSSAVLPDRSAQLWVLASRLLNLQATIGGFSGATLSGVDGLRTNAEFVFDGLNLALLRRELGISAFRARAAVRILDRPLEPGTIRIEFVADDSMARSQGIAGSMLGAVDSLSSEANAGRVELHVEPQSVEARRLYERAKFLFVPPVRESLTRRVQASQTDRRRVKEFWCTTS